VETSFIQSKYNCFCRREKYTLEYWYAKSNSLHWNELIFQFLMCRLFYHLQLAAMN